MFRKIHLTEDTELLELLRPYRKAVTRCLIMVVILVILQMTILISIKPFLSTGIKSTDRAMIVMYGVAIIAVVALHGVFTIVVARISTRTSAEIAVDLRRTIFRKLITAGEYNPAVDTSGIMVRLMSDVDNIQKFVTELFKTCLYSLFLTLGLIIVAMFINIYVGLIFFVAAAIVYIKIMQSVRVELASRREIVTRLESVIHLFRDDVKGAKRRRYLGNIEEDHERFRTVSADYSKVSDSTRIRAFKSTSLPRLMSMILITMITALLLFVTGSTAVQLDTIVMYVQMIILLDSSITLYPFIFETIPIASASLDKIRRAMSTKTEVPGLIPEGDGSDMIVRSESPRYPSLKRGQETAVVMVSDMGSWDFVFCLTGLANVPEGTLYIEGTDVSRIDQSYFPSKVAYAGSNALAINGTILENVRLDRDIDEGRIAEVCRAVGINKPLDFLIERSASNISLGESYRISIARALVSDVDIFVFEDCFISLDNGSKRQIVRYIRSVLEGKTVIFISSDTSISDGSDNIVVVSEGMVVCSGTRADVVGKDGLYDDLRKTRWYADAGC